MNSLKKQIGAYGETLAVEYLRQKGYIILDRNVKISYQEIDIVAQQQDTIIFIEVKTRTSSAFGSAEESLTSRQIKNLKKALSVYLFQHKFPQEKVRLDLFAINLDRQKKIAKIKHYKDIF